MTRRCPECNQVGYIPIKAAEIGPAAASVSEVQRAWVFLQNHHVLPEPGGLYEQAAMFVDSALVLDQLESLATRIEMDEAKAKAGHGPKQGPQVAPQHRKPRPPKR
jgi:hypothetical protein